jgi:hypothetical protein
MVRSFLSRHRFLTNILALAFVLGTLAIPAAADPDPIWCDNGCINWAQQSGCITCQRCCVYGEGQYTCWDVNPVFCLEN